jgi:hypothetical protein
MKGIVKVKFIIITIFLLGFLFSFDPAVTSGDWNIDMTAERMHPIRYPEVWINGDNSPHYDSSRFNVNNILPGDSFTVEIMADSISSEFPVLSNNQPRISYAIYYGFSDKNEFTVLDADGITSQEYIENAEVKFWKKGRITDSYSTILNISKNPIPANTGYMWISFVWIVDIAQDQKAVVNEQARINVRIN